jgi:hypothetical protein
MKRLAICLAAALVAAVVLSPAPAWAQTETRVTGGGGGVFPSGTTFNDIPLAGLKFGMGVIISADGPAKGQFQATLLSPSASIEINGKVSAGSIGSGGTATLSGACSLDLGDGNLPLLNVPFTVAVTTNAEGRGALGLVIGATSLPAATVNEGSMTIQ